jgi:hypothetical protein
LEALFDFKNLFQGRYPLEDFIVEDIYAESMGEFLFVNGLSVYKRVRTGGSAACQFHGVR